MKKVFLAIALTIGTFGFVNAQTVENPAPQTETTQQEGYKVVSLGDLNQKVQDAIKAIAGDAYDIITIEFDAAKELTRVTFVSKADQSEKVVVLNSEGQE